MDEELNSVIVEESKKGEKEREEEEQAEASARQNVASIRQGFQPPFSVFTIFLGKNMKVIKMQSVVGADASIRSSFTLRLWFHAPFFLRKPRPSWIEQKNASPVQEVKCLSFGHFLMFHFHM